MEFADEEIELPKTASKCRQEPKQKWPNGRILYFEHEAWQEGSATNFLSGRYRRGPNDLRVPLARDI